MINKSKLILISSAILIFTSVSAFAQTTRVYVADSGDDANLCTRAAQCRTITKALTVVKDGGEVIITESGDYDNFTVTKSVTVAAEPGVDAEIATDVSAVIIGVWQGQQVDSVTIRNLIIKHITSNSTQHGIRNYLAANLYVDGCTITGFNAGVADLRAGKLFVHNSIFRNNGVGITTNAPTDGFGEGLLYAVIDNSKFEHNTTGVLIDAKTYATIHDCLMFDNWISGIIVASNKSGQRAEAVIDHCQLTGNQIGLEVNSSVGPSAARVSNTTITQNLPYGIRVISGAIVYSFQNNVINGNPTNVLGALTPVSLQ